MSYTSTIAVSLGQSKTGLSLAAELIGTTGAIIASNVTGGFFEVGLGSYLFTYASFPDGFRGAVKFLDRGNASGLMAIAAMNPEEVEYPDVKTSTRAIPYVAAFQPIFTIPTTVGDGSVLQLRLTDDYFNTENRSMDATSDSWPNLVGSTVVFAVDAYNSTSSATSFSKNITIIDYKTVRIELSRTELATIGSGKWPYEIYTTLTNGNVVTLITGNLEIIAPFAD